jgi:hypothetical protein
MRLIRVTYRATFEQSKVGPLNPIGCRWLVPISIEVYPTPGKWWVRIPTDGEAQNPPLPLVAAGTAEQMKRDIAAQFEKQVTPWEMWGNPGTKMDRPRVLRPDEVEVRENGSVYFKG